MVPSIGFQTFFEKAFKIAVDSWKFIMSLLYILWDGWPIFMISGLKEQLQQEVEYTLLKPDCHSWWISKFNEDTLEDRYAIKFCFKRGKHVTETYGILQTAFRPSCMNRASVFEWHRKFREGREYVRDDERCGRSKEVNTPELIGLGLGIVCWGFKGVQEKTPSEEGSTLQIGSVVFPPGQYTSPRLHPCHRLFELDGQMLTLPIVETLLPVTFDNSLSSEAVVMRQLTRWKRLWRRSLIPSNKTTSMGLPEVVRTVQQVHRSRKRLLWKGLEFHVCTINKSDHTRKVWKLI